MGTEAGEPLSFILHRKEIERQACGGLFFWGVGNPMGAGLMELKARVSEPMVLFSEMLCKPAARDAAPSGLLLWLSYMNDKNEEADLPIGSLITSRRTTASGRPKSVHYALVCASDRPLCSEPVGQLHARNLVNIVSGRPVGSTQVTAAVQHSHQYGTKGAKYTINFAAQLRGPGQVRLVRFVELERNDLVESREAADRGDVRVWQESVRKLKQRLTHATRIGTAS
jgi:hypothetical protein